MFSIKVKLKELSQKVLGLVLLISMGKASSHYSQSGRSVLCKFEDCLKIDFHDWMTIRILVCYLLPLLFECCFCCIKDCNRSDFS